MQASEKGRGPSATSNLAKGQAFPGSPTARPLQPTLGPASARPGRGHLSLSAQVAAVGQGASVASLDRQLPGWAASGQAGWGRAAQPAL